MSDFVEDPFDSPGEQESKLNIEDFQDAYILASSGERFANYLIDWFGFVLICFPILTFFDIDDSANLFLYGGSTVYYILLETTNGRTLGKLITGTKVVHEDGGPASFTQVLGRSFSRLVPFDAFSFLGSEAVGWHDKWSKTRVIKVRSQAGNI
mgnify:CR=1 FL=1